MPKLVHRNPAYRRHSQSGDSFVQLSGERIYLGRFGSKETKQEYDRCVAAWIANGRRPRRAAATADLSITELIADYWEHARAYYVKPVLNADRTPKIDDQGKPLTRPTSEQESIHQALPLKKLYGSTAAAEFGPLALKSVREAMVKLGWCRSNINKQVLRIKQMFKWSVAAERVPASVHHGLQAVPGLRKGRVQVRESQPVRPVPEEYVQATLRVLPRQIQAMVKLQVLSGMRSGELVIIRGVDIDTTGRMRENREAA
jgi:integrase